MTRFRASIFVDIYTDTIDEATKEAQDISISIPNSYLGEVFDVKEEFSRMLRGEKI